MNLQGICQDGGIRFENNLSWDQIKQKAGREQKYIFVDCYASWCGPCKAMDRDVYTNTEVGTYINSRFVSLKVQMDSTSHDDDHARKFYSLAKELDRTYHIGTYPSFLFFTPDGSIVHRGLGYRDSSGLLDLVKIAQDPEKQYYTLVSTYRKGQSDSVQLLQLSDAASSFGDIALSDSVSQEYEKRYINGLPDRDLCQRWVISFYGRHTNVLNAQDRFFQLAYMHPESIDTIVKNFSDRVVKLVVSRDEINRRIYKNGESAAEPDWKRLRILIIKKYNVALANSVIFDAEFRYYKRVKDWHKFSNYREEKTRVEGLKPGGGMGGDAWMLNADAWEVFMNCVDTSLLERALEWIDKAIPVAQAGHEDLNAYYDTKANLLYKLGRLKEALEYEELAISTSKDEAEAKLFASVKEKMQRGEPTYDARWNN